MLQKLSFNRKLRRLNVFLMKNEEEVETSTKGVQEDEVKNDMNLNNSWWFFERAPTISLFLMNNRCKSVILFLLFYV